MLIGFLSDAHGHVPAFHRGLSILHEAGAQQIFFLGDAIGYIPDAGVIRALRASDIPALRGNHEDMMLRDASADRESIYRHGETLAQLTLEERAFVSSWPEQEQISVDGCDCLLVHGSPLEPLTGYVYPDSELAPLRDVSADMVLMGHTHHPFVRQEHGKIFVNVGSCGMPRGADARAAVCLLDTSTRDVRILRYDIAEQSREVLARYDLAPAVVSLLKRTIEQDRDLSR